MGDHRDNNTDPNARGQHYEQGFWPSPQTLPPNVQQTQYYEQGFWQPPQALLPTVQHTWMPPSTDDRAFGYDSHPNQLQGPYSGAADQHPYLHGFGHIQPSPPQQWGYNGPSQVPSPFHIQHQRQPVPDRPRYPPLMEGALGATTRPSFQPMAAGNQVYRNAPGPASPFPMPPTNQVHRNTPGRPSQYQLPYRGPPVGASQMLTTMHPSQIEQSMHPPPPPSQSPPTLGPTRPPERSTRGNLLPSMHPTSARHTFEASAQRSARAGRQPSSRWDPMPPALFAPSPAEPHRGPKTERTTRPPERPVTANRSHPMPGFSGSHIQEANFTSVGGSYSDHRRVRIQNYNIGPESDPRRDTENRHFLDELARRSAPGAVANAEERAYAPRCLHETRTRVLNDLGEWSAAEGRWKDAKLLVLTGPAGHGKTAIMQSFSEQLMRKSRGTDVVVVTFFFKSTVPDQSQARSLITTLAHQIVAKCPSIRREIVAAIRNDIGILSASLEDQVEHLLVNPIVNSQATSPGSSHSLIGAVDGLDECKGDEAQARVIRLLHSLSTVPNTRVVIASRPEFAIMEAVSQGIPGLLHVDLNQGDARDDIYKFVWAQLLEIRNTSRLKIDPLQWPSEEDALKISDYSSGQFILAAVAMRYVGERRHDPRERLKEVLALCGPGGNDVMSVAVPSKQPLEPLDKLFTGILVNAGRNANPDDPEEGQRNLSSLVWTLMRIASDLPLWVLEESQGLQAGRIVHELSDLHSLLEVPEDPYWCGEIRPHHKSFLDFLEDPRRSSHLGNIPHVAERRLDLMLKGHLSSLRVDDLKGLVLGQHVRPHILHWLHLFCEPTIVIESIDPEVWEALLCQLNAWETLLLKQWVHLGLSQGHLLWDFSDSKMHRMMDEASERSLCDLLPGLENEGPLDPPPISDTDTELFLAMIDGQGDRNVGCERSEFIPRIRTGPAGRLISSFPWFPAACALAWLWLPSHRLITGHSRVIQPPGTPNPHPPEPSHIVFITGSAGSGKQELLEEGYRLLPAGREDGPPEGWMPPVDIIIVPDTDGVSLRSIWTPGAFGHSYIDTPYNNTDLTGKINLSCNIPASLFQDWVACWETKHEKNTYHPQFLLQGLHLLSPEHQAALLDVISSDIGQSGSTGRLPLFITVTSIPTATLASKLRQFSWPGVYCVNLDGMKADVSILEGALPSQTHTVPQLKIHKLARILAASPKLARHLKRFIDHWVHDRVGWENRLDTVLAAPESEAWRLIEEHFGEILSDDEGGESGEEDWESDEDQSSGESDEEGSFNDSD